MTTILQKPQVRNRVEPALLASKFTQLEQAWGIERGKPLPSIQRTLPA
jgi:hypothetical protein